jgi:TatA/E family protein of Tat protein translocase
MNIGPEMLFLVVLAFLLFGPKKLPEIGRQIGRGLAEFRRASNELRGQLENEMRLLEAEDREKKISPPSPAHTVAAPDAGDATAAKAAIPVPANPEPQLSLPMAEPAQAVAVDSDPPPSAGPGVESA